MVCTVVLSLVVSVVELDVERGLVVVTYLDLIVTLGGLIVILSLLFGV